MKFEMTMTELQCKAWGVDIGFSKNMNRKKRGEAETKSIFKQSGFAIE